MGTRLRSYKKTSTTDNPISAFMAQVNNDVTSNRPACRSDDDSDDTDLEDAETEIFKCSRLSKRCSPSQALYYKACDKYNIPISRALHDQLDMDCIIARHSSLGPLEIKTLCVSLVSNLTVRDLDLKGNCLEDLGAEFVAEMMADNITIRNLNLSENQLGSEAAKAVGDILQHSVTLRSLILAGNTFKECDAYHFARGLQTNVILRELDLSHNEFSEQGGVLLGHLLANNDSLEYLNLSWNHLRMKGAQGIAKGLGKNHGLTRLDLSWNGFADDGAKAIAEALKENTTLIHLNMSSNRISPVGAKHIAEALKVNNVIEIIELGKNHISSAGALQLLTAVSNNKSSKIMQLDLQNITVTYNMEALIQEVMETRPGFQVSHGALVFTDDVIGHDNASNYYEADPFRLLLAWAQAKGLRLWDLFSQFDKDGSMSLSRDEFKEAMKVAQLPIDGHKLDRLIDYLDKDGDGQVDFGELLVSQKEVRLKDRKLSARRRQKLKQMPLRPNQEDPILPETLTTAPPSAVTVTKSVIARRKISQTAYSMKLSPRNIDFPDDDDDPPMSPHEPSGSAALQVPVGNVPGGPHQENETTDGVTRAIGSPFSEISIQVGSPV